MNVGNNYEACANIKVCYSHDCECLLQYTNTDMLDDNNEELDMEIVDKSDRRTCFDLFRKFMKEVYHYFLHKNA